MTEARAATATWKGLPRRHPCVNTADRIRDHIDRYRMGAHTAFALRTAAHLLDLIAEKEPNR